MRNPIAGPLGLGLLSLSFLAAGCAYFNTFYLAKKYYREGRRAQERTIGESIAPEAASKYDAAIRQCQKVLTDYPKSKWADDAAFLLAASTYGKGDYRTAIHNLEAFRETYPKSTFLPEARLIEGMAHLKRRDYADADSIFVECDRRFPNPERAWDLYFSAGESRASQREYRSALGWYARAVDKASSGRERADAWRRTGDALVAVGRPDSAVMVYERAIRAEERPKYRLDLALARAEALRDLQQYEEALAYLERWRPNAIAEKREGELMLRLHDVQSRLGRAQEAIAGYRRLVELYPNTPVAYDAQFRIGYLYESGLDDFDTAAKEYEKLKSAAPSEFQTQAIRRSQGLASLKQYRATLAADTSQVKARSAFLLAELYYFQLERPDSALRQYEIVEAQFPQSVYAPKSAYARLWITALSRGDTMAVAAMTDSMTVRYRGTRFAENALYFWKRWSGLDDARTALLDSLLENPDTTGVSRFAPEEVEAPPEAIPAASRPDSGYAIPPESMNLLNARRAALLGRVAPAPPRPGSAADSLRSAAGLDSGRVAPPDSLRAAPPDSLRAAPPDSTRSPGPSGPPPSAAPADSATIFINPQR